MDGNQKRAGEKKVSERKMKVGKDVSNQFSGNITCLKRERERKREKEREKEREKKRGWFAQVSGEMAHLNLFFLSFSSFISLPLTCLSTC